MKREILFRGKDCFGYWQEGSLITDNKTFWFIDNHICKVKVDEKTVGQYTGLIDKNGRKIFEGDIVSKKRRKDPNNFASEYWHNPDYSTVVLFYEGSFATDDDVVLSEYMYDYKKHNILEVMGNIHDNPELL